MTVTRIDVMAEWGCDPVWFAHEDGAVDNVDPISLDIPADLAQSLRDWAQWWDDVFDADYPPDTEFPDESQETEFIRRGEELARRLASVLNPSCPVIYMAAGDQDIDVTTHSRW